MSKYTTEVRFICEAAAGYSESKGFTSIAEIVNKAAPAIFNFSWPIYDESARLPLEVKILTAYYTREICEETVGLWKLRLQQKLNEIMPYYNQLYKSAQMEYDPLNNIDLTTTENGTDEAERNETYTQNQSGSGTANTTSTGNELNAFSATPQGSVQDLKDYKYLTDARDITTNGSDNTTNNFENESTNTGKQSENKTTEKTTKVKGINGSKSFAQLVLEYRETMLNIDAMVIKELSELFFGLWE